MRQPSHDFLCDPSGSEELKLKKKKIPIYSKTEKRINNDLAICYAINKSIFYVINESVS